MHSESSLRLTLLIQPLKQRSNLKFLQVTPKSLSGAPISLLSTFLFSTTSILASIISFMAALTI